MPRADAPPRLERSCELDRLPPRWRARFEALPEDPFVAAFARGEHAAPHGWVRGALRSTLRRVVSDFDADGLLGTHPMALFGPRSWEALVGGGGRLLDVGAGSGDVTAHARELFDEIVTTEVSGPMVRRLRRRGFVCHRVDLATEALPGEATFDVVSVLDVLDRCDRPRSLLRAAGERLAPGGRLLVSVPLPVRAHVDVGGVTVDADEPLRGHGDSWEEALVDLLEGTLEPCGVEVLRLARAPYLSRGSTAAPLHVLDAAVVVGARR
jgi:SAM-dependent methyltransferase